ncbi:MAG: response regulator [Bacteroidia bacterium]
MINAILIDDEKSAREALSLQLEAYCKNVNLMAQCINATEGIEAINQLKPELVFLDVEMPDMTGFEMLKKLGTINFSVIFSTAHDMYAARAFKFSALDFLLKPVDKDELIEAIKKYESKTQMIPTVMQLQMMMQNFKEVSHKPFNKIALPGSDGLNFVELDNIIRLESDVNYTNFFLDNKQKVLVSKTLKEYDELLSEHNFLRVHQSHLINMKHIIKYVKGDGGYVVMSDGSSVSISLRKKSEVLERLTQL